MQYINSGSSDKMLAVQVDEAKNDMNWIYSAHELNCNLISYAPKCGSCQED